MSANPIEDFSIQHRQDKSNSATNQLMHEVNHERFRTMPDPVSKRADNLGKALPDADSRQFSVEAGSSDNSRNPRSIAQEGINEGFTVKGRQAQQGSEQGAERIHDSKKRAKTGTVQHGARDGSSLTSSKAEQGEDSTRWWLNEKWWNEGKARKGVKDSPDLKDGAILQSFKNAPGYNPQMDQQGFRNAPGYNPQMDQQGFKNMPGPNGSPGLGNEFDHGIDGSGLDEGFESQPGNDHSRQDEIAPRTSRPFLASENGGRQRRGDGIVPPWFNSQSRKGPAMRSIPENRRQSFEDEGQLVIPPLQW